MLRAARCRPSRYTILTALLLVRASLLPTLLALPGRVYVGGGFMLGTIYCVCGAIVFQRWLGHSEFHARRLLMKSVLYLPMLFFIMVMNKQCALGVESREVKLSWERCRSREAKEAFDNV